MKLSLLTLVLAAIGLAQVVSGGTKVVTPPSCMTHCWDNSKYVTSCVDATHCLCTDEPFQTAVYHCINSQCSASQLALALHHALSLCYDNELNESSSAPALIRRNPVEVQAQTDKPKLAASVALPEYNRHVVASVPYDRPMRSARRAGNQPAGSRVVRPTPVTSITSTSSTPCPPIIFFTTASSAYTPSMKTETRADGATRVYGGGSGNGDDHAYGDDNDHYR